MLHSRISANNIDRLLNCPESIDFGTGSLQQAGMYYVNSQQSYASVRGQVIDELTKNKFAKKVNQLGVVTRRFETPVTINHHTYEWGEKGVSEFQLLGDRASEFFFTKLHFCDTKHIDHYLNLNDIFVGFPDVQFYLNPSGVEVAYNPKTDTEFSFGASPDFGGIVGDTAYALELKTGTAYGKNLETQIKVSALAYVINYENINTVIGGCYNVDTEEYKEWTYTREELLEYMPNLKKLIRLIYENKQPEYLTGVREIDWCKNCACKRCPYSRVNKDNRDFQKAYKQYLKDTNQDWDEELAKGLW